MIADDAAAKLRLAAARRDALGGAPWWLAVGFVPPAFRVPAPFIGDFPDVADIEIAAYPTLDATVAPIAHHDTGNGADPWHALDDATARAWRLHYRACVSWVDSLVGRVLDELDAARGRRDARRAHADHGWSLGEHGEWEKFSNFEHGTRVPLIVRAPWLPWAAMTRGAAGGVRTQCSPSSSTSSRRCSGRSTGLVDPAFDELDGTSLLPVLEAPADAAPRAPSSIRALSVHALPRQHVRRGRLLGGQRLPAGGPRRSFLRVHGAPAAWPSTAWFAWNATSLGPVWDARFAELYNHTHDDGRADFDLFENANEIESADPAVLAQMREVLREAVESQARLPGRPRRH